MLSASQFESLTAPGIENRRSPRIPLSIQILVAGIDPQSGSPFEATGTTLVVNKHGALIRTIPGLQAGMSIRITIAADGKSAKARIVWDSPQSEGRYGVELETPDGLWPPFFLPTD